MRFMVIVKASPESEAGALPTTEELRFMAFYGVQQGSQGVFFFSFQTLPVEFKNLNAVSSLIDALKKVREYLAGERVDAAVYLDYPHAAAWQREGRTLLLITNPTGVTRACGWRGGGGFRVYKGEKNELAMDDTSRSEEDTTVLHMKNFLEEILVSMIAPAKVPSIRPRK